MTSYQIIIEPCEAFKNSRYKNTLPLSKAQLAGIAAFATNLFDIDRDDYLKIYKASSEKLVDLDKVLDNSECIVFQGDPAEDLEPEMDIDWLDRIGEIILEYDEDTTVNQKYTIKYIPASDDEKCSLIQFDNWEFTQGLYGVCKWMGIDPKSRLNYLHRKNEALDLPK